MGFLGFFLVIFVLLCLMGLCCFFVTFLAVVLLVTVVFCFLLSPLDIETVCPNLRGCAPGASK